MKHFFCALFGGIVFLAALTASALLENLIPIMAFAAVVTAFPVWLSIRGLADHIAIMQKSLVTTGTITAVRGEEKWTVIAFEDSSGVQHTFETALFWVFSPKKGRR